MDGTGEIGTMNIVLYTQRVEIVKSYGERRDCADQNIAKFILACGFLPVPIPNVKEVAEKMVASMKPSGIIFTGGNSLVKYGGDAPERDETERYLLQQALEQKIPVYGFCRGMQSILDFYDCALQEVTGHVAVKHVIDGTWGKREVNSFHNQACLSVKDPVEVLAKTEDGVIEAIRIKGKKIIATMWHPERETEFQKTDMDLVRSLFGKLPV